MKINDGGANKRENGEDPFAKQTETAREVELVELKRLDIDLIGQKILVNNDIFCFCIESINQYMCVYVCVISERTKKKKRKIRIEINGPILVRNKFE